MRKANGSGIRFAALSSDPLDLFGLGGVHTRVWRDDVDVQVPVAVSFIRFETSGRS